MQTRARVILFSALMLLCAYVDRYDQLLAVCVVFGLGSGLILPGNLASLSLRSATNTQGKVAGVNMIAQGIGWAIGPISGAGLYRISPQAPFILAALLLAAGAGLALLASHRLPRGSVNQPG